MTYTAWGPVRGDCGHRHRTFATAERCAARDMRDCRSVRGYSDRIVLAENEIERDSFGGVIASSVLG